MASAMTVGRKFSWLAGGLLAALAIVGGASMYSLANLNQVTQKIVTDPLPGLASIAMARSAVLTLRGDVWRHIAQTDPKAMALLDQSIEEQKGKGDAALQEYAKTAYSAEDRSLLEKTTSLWRQVVTNLPAVLALSRASKNVEARDKYEAVLTPLVNEMKVVLESEMNLNRKNGEALAAQSEQSYMRTLWMLSAMLGICLLGGAGLAIVIVRGTNQVLRRVVSELFEGAEQVASAAGQLSSTSQSLAQGSSEQAASLEETSASSEQINSMALKNTENSTAAAGLVSQSQQKFVQTNRSLEEMVLAMAEINASSDKISKIIKVIDEIAFQTNILALNAAVEAARAGEAGMGFAVVADEVRTLAQRCAQAAKDTASLIEESISKSNDGKQKVDQVAGAIRAITEEAVQVKVLVDEVSVGSQEQTRGIEQVAKAITQMQQVTQQTAANAEEGAAAAEELTAQSQALKEIVGSLTELVGTRSGSAHSFGGHGRPSLSGTGRSKSADAASPFASAHDAHGASSNEAFRNF